MVPSIPSPAARGIICMVGSTILLTCQDGVSKWLVASMHAGEIMAWRALLAIPLVLVLVRLEGNSYRTLRSRAPRQAALRSVLALITSALVILSFRVLPLAEALSIIFISPLLITALSALILKEHVGWRRWLATGVGFAGVLILVGPSFDAVGLWALAPLGAAFSTAFRDIATRTLGAHDPGPSILFWTMCLGAAGGFASMPVFGATVPDAGTWALLILSALLLTLAYRLGIAAFKLASGAVVAPLRYLSVVWAGILGYAIWGDVPDMRMVLGSAVVIGAGIYVWRRELYLARQGRLR